MKVIAGAAKGCKLFSPTGKQTRPTSDKVKGSLFNIIGPAFFEVAFLDLFAGCGAVGVEALSRGASLAVFVEKSFTAKKHIIKNLKKTGLETQGRVIGKDVLVALKLLSQEKQVFDFIFLDPPYRTTLIPKVLIDIDEKKLLAKEGIIIVEHNINNIAWVENDLYVVIKQKSYGDTRLTFLKVKNQRRRE